MSDRTQSSHAQRTEQRDGLAVVSSVFDKARDRYMKLLPNHVEVEDFKSAFLMAVQRNPRLLDADKNSLWLALQNAATDGLKPDGREGALVIFADDSEDEEGKPVPAQAKRLRQVVWMPMVWGLLKTVRNAQDVVRVTVECVYEGEHIAIVMGDEPRFEHTRSTDPDFDDGNGKIIGAYAIIHFANGAIEREWMSRSKLERVRAVSRSKKGPWLPWFDEQCRKVVLRRVMKRCERSPTVKRLTESLERDESIGTEFDGESQEIIDRVAAPPPEQRRRFVEMPDRQEQDPPRREPDRAPQAQRQERAPEAPQGQSTETPPQFLKPATDKPAQGDDGFAGYLVDPDGVEVPDGPIQGAMAFARAFVALCRQHPKAVDDLLEINGAAIEDACDTDPAVRAVIEAVRLPDEKRDGPNDPGPVHEQDIPVAVPVTPKNAPHWPNYAAACEVALQALTTKAEIDHWIAVNEAVYGQRAIKGKVVSLIRVRLTELGIGETQETGREPVEDAIARLPKMDAGDFQRLHASAVHRTWVNDLFPPDRERYLAAEAARIAELRVPA